MDRLASLPMYDTDRAAVAAWWQGLARALRHEGLSAVPSHLQWPVDLHGHWTHADLLLSQCCGYPLVTVLAGNVQVVGAWRYGARGCESIDYRSALLVRADDPGRRVEDFRGRVAAFNGRDSHSGCNALRALVAPMARSGRFFASALPSGSHRASIAWVRDARADIAAIDCVTLALLQRHEPQALAGLRILGSTAPAPGLPLVTSRRCPAGELEAMRRALRRACEDPALADARAELFIEAFEPAEASRWAPVAAMACHGAKVSDFDVQRDDDGTRAAARPLKP